MSLLFEIGCEDLPSRFVIPAIEQLKTNFEKFAKEERISFNGLSVEGTPRRIVLMVEYVHPRQEDLNEERTGPPVAAAYKDGEPTKAAIGFAKGLGIDVTELYSVKTEKGEYIAGKRFKKGEETAELLPNILKKCIDSFNFPKSMRWAYNPKSFARPIRWILAIYNGEIVPFTLEEYGNIKSGNITYGNRFLPPLPEEEIRSIEHYKHFLIRTYVVLSPDFRRRQIEALLSDAAKLTGGSIPSDPELLDEVTNLVEKPYAVLLHFDESYLELPDEVLITSMRTHQRYFPICNTETGKLLNSCVIIYNTLVRDPDVVCNGNHRVLRARLDDAKFFWNQDLKQPLESYNEKLKTVTWLKEIGSMAERVDRITQLTEKIALLFQFSDDDVRFAKRAAQLSKADLVTNMVFEFTDLQGVMGREYALKSGEPTEVATAIYEQYLPKGVDDDIPHSNPGSALSLAEKLDALVGCFGSNIVPTATTDPYALRRAAIGVVKILQALSAPISLKSLLELAYDVYEKTGVKLKCEREQTIDKLEEFIFTRLANQLTSQYPTDIVQAVLAIKIDDIPGVVLRVQALSEFRNQPEFDALAAGYKRVDNLLKKNDSFRKETTHKLLPIDEIKEEAERELMQAYQTLSKEVDAAEERQNWLDACKALVGMKAPIDRYFEDVMVMCDDLDLRFSRLSHLAAIQKVFLRIADLSQIN